MVNPAATETLYYFQSGAGDRYSVSVSNDGLLHASIVAGGPCCRPNVTMVGPSSPVTDELWHYITVDFANWYIYRDLTPGPKGTANGGGLGSPNVVGSASITVGAGYEGQIDELASYPTPLSSSRRSAHATAGGLGWDNSLPGGSEEGSPPGCTEYGAFWKGAADQLGSTNYNAYGTINYITTALQPYKCGLPRYIDKNGNTVRETYITGQTARVKLSQNTLNYYVEFGPIQYLCSVSTTCWGMFFNYKIPSLGINAVCTISITTGAVLSNEDVFTQQPPYPQNVCTFDPGASQAATACSPPTTKYSGIHGYKIEHESGQWVAYLLCDTSLDTPDHKNATGQAGPWKQIVSHVDAGYPANGFPDAEGFEQGYDCPPPVSLLNCWRREAPMTEVHSKFLWLNSDIYQTNTWNNVAYGVCRDDKSYRWDGSAFGVPPVSITWVENHRVAMQC